MRILSWLATVVKVRATRSWWRRARPVHWSTTSASPTSTSGTRAPRRRVGGRRSFARSCTRTPPPTASSSSSWPAAKRTTRPPGSPLTSRSSKNKFYCRQNGVRWGYFRDGWEVHRRVQLFSLRNPTGGHWVENKNEGAWPKVSCFWEKTILSFIAFISILFIKLYIKALLWISLNLAKAKSFIDFSRVWCSLLEVIRAYIQNKGIFLHGGGGGQNIYPC